MLGIREGNTENAAVAKALLADLVGRGLPSDRALVFVIDGSIAVRQATVVRTSPPALGEARHDLSL
jgi:hypothetical protein